MRRLLIIVLCLLNFPASAQTPTLIKPTPEEFMVKVADALPSDHPEEDYWFERPSILKEFYLRYPDLDLKALPYTVLDRFEHVLAIILDLPVDSSEWLNALFLAALRETQLLIYQSKLY